MSYKDLESLNAQINQCIQKDNEKIDLLSSFDASSELLQADNLFKHEQTVPFPECIIERIEEPDCPCKMGFLPLLKRTWLSAGKTLFIWENLSDIFIYESQEIIENVFVVDINQEHSYGLIIATPNRLFLHQVTIEDNNNIKICSHGSFTTYNVIMLDIVKGINHRYFMKGSDGHLYELEVKSWESNRISFSISLHCRTERPLMRYLPTFFKSEPEVRVKSVAVDNNKALLYLLSDDSTIQVNTIAGKTYITSSKYKGSHLESLHIIPESESDTVCLMAVTNTAERLYFKNNDNVLEVVHTEKAPSVHGALLFNHQSNEKIDLTYYNQGVFAALLSKSEKSILVFAASEYTEDNKILPSYYQENVTKKIWSIMEDHHPSTTRHYLKATAELPGQAHRKLLTLSADGVSIYSKQKPIDTLSQILSIQSVRGIERFLSIYGSKETAAMCLALTANPSDCHAAMDQYSKSHDKATGLTIYLSRLVSSLWDYTLNELKVNEISAAGLRISHLKQTLEGFNIELEKNLETLILYSIQGIQLLCYIHKRGWDTIVSQGDSTSMTFRNLISTEKGAQLIKKLILSTIYALKPGKDNHNCDISEFLKNECNGLVENAPLLFYRGMEHLQNVKNGSKQELEISLESFTMARDVLSLDELKGIISDYCSFDFHLGAVQLIYEKVQVASQLSRSLDDLLFQVFKHALDKSEEYGQQVLQTVLSNKIEQDYHYKIYDWLIKADQLLPFIKLHTDFIVPYLKTCLPENQGLDILWQYYEHNEEFGLAKSCLEYLATQVDSIPLSLRVEYMEIAIDCASKDEPENIQEIERLTRILDTAQIQFNLHKELIENSDVSAKSAAASLVLQLKPIDVLLEEYAIKHNIYSEALCLIHLQRSYSFKYVTEAWKSIIHQSSNSDLLKAKIIRIGQRIYPSIYAFPVYTLVELLDDFVHKHELREDLAMETLCEIDVPEEVVTDARSLLKL